MALPNTKHDNSEISTVVIVVIVVVVDVFVVVSLHTTSYYEIMYSLKIVS